MIVNGLEHLAQVAAARGVNTVLEGTALAAFSWCTLRWFGRQSSMTRFAVWFATLLVIAALPFVNLGGASISAYDPAPELTLSGSWGTALFAAWAAIASLLMMRIALSLIKIGKIRRQCQQMNDAGLPLQTAELNRTRQRRARILVSDEVRVPTALGFFRPAVVLPRWTLQQLSADELKAIVLHELAHLRRWDDWTNLAQKMVKALFFFHPAVWWIDSRLALERELACDDLVLEQTKNARTYAASLVSVAEKVVAERMRMGRALALAQTALGRMREVSKRVTNILDTKRAASGRGWRPAIAMIGTLALVAAAAMPYAPEVVSFEAKEQPGTFIAKAAAIAITVTPASLRWAGENAAPYMRKNFTDEDVHRPNHTLSVSDEHARRSTNDLALRGGGFRRPARTDAAVIRAKAQVRTAERAGKVVMAKAPATTHTSQRFLVLHTSEMDPYGGRWTLSVWRYTTEDGTRVVQETIVMSSI